MHTSVRTYMVRHKRGGHEPMVSARSPHKLFNQTIYYKSLTIKV